MRFFLTLPLTLDNHIPSDDTSPEGYSMALKICLIGRPAIVADSGGEQFLRSHQAWALLARLVLQKRPIDRRRLAGELFPETQDPLGALRWCLGAIRKTLGAPESLRGDPVQLKFPPDTEVDVWRINEPDFEINEVGEFLEGVEPRCSPELSTWLLVERERIAGLVEGHIRNRVLANLSSGNASGAIRFAELGARLRPYDEGAHILLVKSLAEAGRHEAAAQHIDNTQKVFTAELGEKPSAALWSAGRRAVSSPPVGVRSEAVAVSLLESGLAAVAAGAVEAGIDCLRRSIAVAESSSSRELVANTTLELGVALVHSLRGYDDEGAVLLQRATTIALECGAQATAAKALRELGYVEALAGRRPSAEHFLDQALKLAEDLGALAGIHAVIGFNLVDWGRVREGLEHYEISLSHARQTRSRRREIWSLGLGAWGLLKADRLGDAEHWLANCLELVDEQNWVAFKPWPTAVQAEVRLRQQVDPSAIRKTLEGAFALSCQIGDPCWEAATARVIGLTHLAEDHYDVAAEWLSQARARCLKQTDRFAALLVAIISDQMNMSVKTGLLKDARGFARELIPCAARAHMDREVRLATAVLAL
ncbi:AfsR/SARP family transcriptional regulator [Neorhizobium galegae]|uniref:AfsR/SARP family transcriptional regulator n=1 Tax=Neorhizobium galegae TaxID=399 RepID=UPI000627995C|nr:hypothetical protein F4V90_29405 [Neorhizobium galegae]MCQ1575209.1 hypothetical protein [Neorhizobium galegae]MCQ1809033.1 hypothetical protein [Neorhizobium galegae]MCQ1839406.1 hypothetical protein [Neorhizobium galegae]